MPTQYSQAPAPLAITRFVETGFAYFVHGLVVVLLSLPMLTPKARLYEHSQDERAVVALCNGVYGGRDYVPSFLSSFDSDPLCFPVVLESAPDKSVVAFANMRALDETPCAPVFLEGVRVSEAERGRGHGTLIIQQAMELVRRLQRAPFVDVVAVTIPANCAMLRVFQKLRFSACGSDIVCNWPGYLPFSEQVSGNSEPSVLRALGVAQLCSEAARTALDLWQPVTSCTDLLGAFRSFLQTARSSRSDPARRPTGFFPSFYGVLTPEGVWEKAEKAGSITLWRFPAANAVLFVSSCVFISIPENRTIVSVCSPTAAGAEAAALFADERLGLSRFRLCIDCAEALDASPLLSAVPSDTFVVRNAKCRE